MEHDKNPMTDRVRLVILAVVLCLAPILSQPVAAEPLFQRENPIVWELRRLYQHAGYTAPIDSYPVSRGNLLFHANRLLERTNNPDIAARTTTLIEELQLPKDRLRLSADMQVHGKVDSRSPADNLPGDYARTYYANPPWLTTHVYLEMPDTFAISVRDERQRRFRDIDHINAPISTENNSIREGFVSTHLGPVDITFGRQNIEIGPSPFSSFGVSPDVPFLDALKVDGQMGPLSMTYFASTLENRQSYGDPPITNENTDFYNYDRNTILFNLHYFSYSFGRWRVGIGSHIIIAREMNEFHMADFFPAANWHNQNLVPNNHALFSDVSWILRPGLELYGIMGLDDINGNTIGINDDEDIPTIYAFSLGAAGSRRSSFGVIDTAVEIGTTHYLWGNFDEGDELARANYRMDLSGTNGSMPLTGRYGPGVLWLNAAVGVQATRHLAVDWQLEVVSRNTLADFQTEYKKNDDIASAARHTTVYNSLRIAIIPRPWVTVAFTPAFRAGDDGFEPSISAELVMQLHRQRFAE